MAGAIERFQLVLHAARKSEGFITSEELHRLGIPSSTVSRWCSRGYLVRFQRGVFRTESGPIGFEEALCLAGKVMTSGQIIGGRTALELWDLPHGSRGRVEVVGSRGSASTSKHIRSRVDSSLRAVDVSSVRGLRVASPIRAVIDAESGLDRHQIGDVLARGQQSGLFVADDVATRMAEIARPGRGCSRDLRELLAAEIRAPDTIRPQNSYERKASGLWRAGGLPPPQAQFRIECAGRVFFVDFAWPDHRVVVECDSMLAHSTASQLQSDLNRQNVLVTAGWRVFRFTYWDITQRGDSVVATLKPFLQSSQ